MDQSQHYSNGLSTASNNGNGYPAQPGISPQHQQQLSQQSSTPHTLPPLLPNQQQQHQQQLAMSHNVYNGSAPNTPRTPGTPNTPGSANGPGFSQQQMQQSGPYRPQQAPMGMTSSYPPPPQRYNTSGSMMPQNSMAMSHPQPIAPAPPQNRLTHPLRPMPPNGMMQQGMQSPYGQGMMQQGMMDHMEPPTHVVGSQGRRGILPSAPGRPPVATGPGKTTLIPTKDADGKFPCPHCTKTYLHAKHLKRHLLRHTGDRPYMCVLCRDTFSRSDILKRHFQKCSIRRGNPTGASHLSHAQAHLKKSHPGPHKQSPSMGNEQDMMGGGMQHLQQQNMQQQNMQQPFGIIPDGSMADAGSHLTDEQQIQQQLSAQSRNSSLHNLNGGQRGGDPSQGGSSRNSLDGGYAGMSNNMPPGTNSLLANPTSNGQNHHSYTQNIESAGNGTPMQSQSMQHPQSQSQNNPNDRTAFALFNVQDAAPSVWSQIYQQPPQNNYVHGYNPSIAHPYTQIKPEPMNSYTPIVKQEPLQSHVHIKPEPNPSTNFLAGMYPGVSHVTNPAADFPNWNFQNDPLRIASERLILFVGLPGRPTSTKMRFHLSPESIKHYLDHFSSFHGHFPVIHMPSFRIAGAYDGLLLGMVCIGAVYSERITQQEVRDMMEIAKAALEYRSQVYVKISREHADAGHAQEIVVSNGSELDEIAAIYMMHVLFTWHGTPEQREEGRRQFPLLVSLARKVGLAKPLSTGSVSALHQPRFSLEGFSADQFDWNAWVNQEKRSRLMYIIFLTDAAMVLYFNMAPLLQLFEIELPLPADDAAWDANSALECAEALGLRGPAAAEARNPEGSRRWRQPEMHSAMRALLHDTYDLKPRTTNLYSKFILIHALHVQLWLAQRQVQGADQSHVPASPLVGSSSLMSQHDWVTKTMDGVPPSNNSSGRATPVQANGQTLKDTNHAFDKWKKAWDEDMMAQYPPPPRSYRRFGFCRDAVHFYYLAKCLIQNNQGLDPTLQPDQRFSHVMYLLNYVKQWVVSDSAKRGEELGSVSDINKEYAITNLTLDMAQLFKPLNKQIDGPVAGVHTNINGRSM